MEQRIIIKVKQSPLFLGKKETLDAYQVEISQGDKIVELFVLGDTNLAEVLRPYKQVQEALAEKGIIMEFQSK
jgi:hypothetical protein